jgi:hypothetical protein
MTSDRLGTVTRAALARKMIQYIGNEYINLRNYTIGERSKVMLFSY